MKRLKLIKKKHSGRGSNGQVVVRHQGGQHKRYLRTIDFKRNKTDIEGKVVSIEYDPNRTSDIALVQYVDGDHRYIQAHHGVKLNDTILSGKSAELTPGNAMPLSEIPLGTFVHNVEINPGKGGQIARGAGAYAVVSAKEGDFAHLKMPSGEMRQIRLTCMATIGQVGNIDWKNKVFGKAGAKRHRGIRPTVRGVAMNPRSHPHGGGEGRSGIGRKRPMTYAGRPAVGKTRRPTKYSNKFILQGRKKRK